MNQIKIEQLEKELEKLEDFIDNGVHSRDEIIRWVSLCVEFFSRLNINDTIISAFIDFYLPVELEKGKFSMSYSVEKLGNFEGGELSYLYKNNGDSYLANIAFMSARGSLRKKMEEERLVPLWIIKQLSDGGRYLNLVSSLELIEKNYQDKDADGIIKNLIALVDNLFDLDSDLRSERNIGKKIKLLKGNEEVRNRFGFSKEFVFAIDNARLIRNEKVTHKTKPIKYDIPFLIAVSNSYLIILMLEIALSCGEVFEKKSES